MPDPDPLLLPDRVRQELWPYVITAVETYLTEVRAAPVAPTLAPAELRALLEPFDFAQPLTPQDAVDFVVKGLWQHQVHTSHPRYFGLFNPAPTTMGIVADLLVAAFNPQLAAWSHSPLANEMERHLLHLLGTRFGYDPAQLDGNFTSGGAEANHTAVLTALVQAFPRFATEGMRGLAAQPVFYASVESHHSLVKAARFCGLGAHAVRPVPVDGNWRMDVRQLVSQINADRRVGLAPFMIVATAGTTSAGAIDPLVATGAIAEQERLWFHVDAAWGGATIFVPELRSLLDGIEQADSITFDAHKWLSVPMAAGIFLTRHPDILDRTCRITTGYMPRDAHQLAMTDPYTHSIQWSRRFIGLKLFLSLAVAGWDGYEVAIRHQVAMGKLLRQELASSQWHIVNQARLAVVCFTDALWPQGHTAAHLDAIARDIVSSGLAWISTTRLNDATDVLRACIGNYRTGPDDVLALVQALNDARQRVGKRG